MSWVVCPGCGRKLGRLENGVFVNKHGRQIIKTERAAVVCPKCGRETLVGRGLT